MRRSPMYAFTAAMAVTLAGSMSMTSQAAGTYQIPVNSGKAVIVSGSSMNEIKDKLNNLLPDCTLPIPDFEPNHPEGNPGTGNPGTGNPGIENPGTPELPGGSTSDDASIEAVVRLVNEERAKAGLSALRVHNGAEAAAQMRAEEIITSFSHTRLNGSAFSTALAEKGVGFTGAGENIAYGQRTSGEVMTGWMNSAGHRANILNSSFTSIGVGHVKNAAGVSYWTQLFIK